MNKRVNFVKEIQELLRKSDVNGVTIQYGYCDEEGFHISDVDVNMDAHKQECVFIKYDNSNHGILQSIECDGLFLILSDIIKAVNRL